MDTMTSSCCGIVLLAGSGGLVSMIVDPTNGQIQECDVIFDSSFFGLAPSALPCDSTAFVHELGHAFGLDHTNLHPGGYPSAGSFTLNPSPSAAMLALITTSRSWFQFVSLSSAAAPPAPSPPGSYPGMTSALTKFPPGTNYLALALHPDDATGLSRIYPVNTPYLDATGVLRDPLINTTATMRGYVAGPTSSPDPLRNVIPIIYSFNSTVNPVAAFPPMKPIVPVVGTVSGLARHFDADVVGMQDTFTQQRGTAGYDLIGIPASGSANALSSSPPVPDQRVNLAVESMSYLGIDPWPTLLYPPAGGPSEWAYEGFLNWTGGNQPPRVPVQHILKNNESNFANGTPRFIGSLAIVPGTIIEVSVTDPAMQGLNGVVLDKTSRPLVEIVERARPSGASMFVATVNVYHNFPLGSLSVTINGTSTTLAGVSLTANITRASANIPAGPARVSVIAKERPVPGTGVTFVAGRNEVRY